MTMFQVMREMHRETVEEETESTSSKEEVQDVVLFGKYELLRLLGVGAFAKVYEATNVVTGQRVAIKAVSKRKVVDGGNAAQFEREIAIMRRLHHPHIVKLFEVLATKTKIYLVMEFAQGGELFDQVVAKRRFSEDLGRRYFQQLISAVQYCHSRGVFHRDLKLDNLLISDDMTLRVSDFGLSAVKGQIRPDGLLHTLCGTPAYLAPEMLAKKGYDGATVDVWGCGVVLFALIAGYLPFNDQSSTAMFRKIYRGQFRFPVWASPDLRRFVTRLLDPNPRTRITLDEILRDPWFGKGYREVKVQQKDPEWEENRTKCLNAFDLISFSSGFDVSGLFNDPDVSDCVERIVSGEAPQRIMAEVEEVAKAEGVTVTTKKDAYSGAKLEGQDGNLVIWLSIYRLTAELVVIEIKKREREGAGGAQFWKHKLRLRLEELVYKTEAPVIR